MNDSTTQPTHLVQDESLREQIDALAPWFHNLRLNGIETAPGHFLGDYPTVKYESFRAALPQDLSGLTVLDIGCNAGFYSFEMKRRGAARVVGIDTDERYLAQARFAAKTLNVEVDFLQMPVWDIADLHERFDLVIFMGVFYHLRHPLLALDLIHEHVAKDWLLFQSMQRGSRSLTPVARDYDFNETAIFNSLDFPAMYFVENSYSDDDTNWWIPNRAGMEAMLRSAGFSIEQHPEGEVYLCRRRELETHAAAASRVYPRQSSSPHRP